MGGGAFDWCVLIFSKVGSPFYFWLFHFVWAMDIALQLDQASDSLLLLDYSQA